jgi:hypothetical protein
MDGRFIGFESCAPNLVGHDFDGLPVVFVRDRGETVTSFVAGLYEHVLGRAPDPGGLAGWIGFLDANCDASGFDALVRAFFGSAEFRGRLLTLNGLVTTLYRAVLGRAPDPGGLLAWAAAFRRERLRLANDVIVSQEFRNVRPDLHDPAAVIALVTRFYAEILGRPPDPGGLQAWVDFILAAGDVDAVALGFLASAEFEARPLTFRGYVTILYRALLGREPDPDGLGVRDGVLRAHLERVITEGFVSSEELQVRRHELCGT